MDEFELMVMTYNIGLQQGQLNTIRKARAQSEQDVAKRSKLRHSLSCMLLLLEQYCVDVMLVQEVGGQEEGLQAEDAEHFMNFLQTMWGETDSGQKLCQDVFRQYEMHANMSYLCWTRRGKVQVLGTSVCNLVQKVPGQTWRVAQVVDMLVTPLCHAKLASGAVRTRPLPSSASVRVVNTHLVSGQKGHSSGHDHSLNFVTRLECLGNATRTAVAEFNGQKPRVSLVCGDLNIDSDQKLFHRFGHGLEERHAWCICDRDSHKDFILSTGATVDSTIPRSLWTPQDEHRVKPGNAHWPIAMTLRWDSGPLPTLPPMPSTRWLVRAQLLVDDAKQKVRHGNVF